MINVWHGGKSKAIAFPACKTRLNFRVRGQFESKILKCGSWTRLISYAFLKNWTWACDHLKSSNLSADTFKILLELRGSIPEPAIRSGDTGQQKHYFDSCQLIKTWMYNIRLQAPKLARKCEIKHWYACGADGRKVGWSVYVHVIAEFSSYGASNWARDQIKYHGKTLKTTWPQWIEKWACDTVKRWWSAYTLVWKLSSNLN